jgi:hypothetical protein
MDISWTNPWTHGGVAVDIHGEAGEFYIANADAQAWPVGFRPASIGFVVGSDSGDDVSISVRDTNGNIVGSGSGAPYTNITIDLVFEGSDLRRFIVSQGQGQSTITVLEVAVETVPMFWVVDANTHEVP